MKKFTIKIAFFNERKGPVCLNSDQNQEWKRISIDALGVEKDNVTFEEGIQIYRIVNVEVPNSSARGNKNRFSVIIRYEKGLGSIKTEITEKIRFEFINLIKKQTLPFDIDSIEKFCTDWERNLLKFKNITDVVEIKNEISTSNQYRSNLFQLGSKGKISIMLILLGTVIAIGITFLYGQTNGSLGFSPIIYIILGTIVLLGIIVAVKTRRILK